MNRKMFSSTTTESSINRENASASPPSSMVLIEPPIAFITSKHVSADSGIDSNTANVARGLPRNNRIISPVSSKSDAAFLNQILERCFHENGLVKHHRRPQRGRNVDQMLDDLL